MKWVEYSEISNIAKVKNVFLESFLTYLHSENEIDVRNQEGEHIEHAIGVYLDWKEENLEIKFKVKPPRRRKRVEDWKNILATTLPPRKNRPVFS